MQKILRKTSKVLVIHVKDDLLRAQNDTTDRNRIHGQRRSVVVSGVGLINEVNRH